MAVAETTATATATVASASAQPSPMALYVGDLADDVAEGQLVGLFSAVGELASVRICKDSVTGRSLGYGYVNYISPHDGIASPPLRLLFPIGVCFYLAVFYDCFVPRLDFSSEFPAALFGLGFISKESAVWLCKSFHAFCVV